MGNGFIGVSVFLAFAWLYPTFELLLFFVLPVQVRYLAWLSWGLIGWTVVTGGMGAKLAAIASVVNFLLFFGKEIVQRVRSGRRRMVVQTQKLAAGGRDEPFHRCTVCGITDRSHPQMDFRYCPDCDGSPGYCADHIHRHDHVRAAEEPARR